VKHVRMVAYVCEAQRLHQRRRGMYRVVPNIPSILKRLTNISSTNDLRIIEITDEDVFLLLRMWDFTSISDLKKLKRRATSK
jgi:hypothetical protein